MTKSFGISSGKDPDMRTLKHGPITAITWIDEMWTSRMRQALGEAHYGKKRCIDLSQIMFLILLCHNYMYHVSTYRLYTYVIFGGIRFLQFVPNDQSVLIWRSNIISAEGCHKNHVTSNVFITGVSPIRPWTCRILWCRILMDHQSTTWNLPMERSMLQGRYTIDQLCKKSSKKTLQHQKGMWHACFFYRRCLTVESPLGYTDWQVILADPQLNHRIGWVGGIFLLKSLVVGTWVVFLE